MKCIQAAIAVVVSGGKVLICQRKDDDTLGGFWEFPGGKVEDGESFTDCLARELREEIDIVAEPVAQLTTIEHTYPHAKIRLHPFVCRHVEGEPKLLECQAACWIEPHELRDRRFPPANEKLIEEVIAYLSAEEPPRVAAVAATNRPASARRENA